jgi:hypothetical protein
MSDEESRILERERRLLGLSAQDYLRYLAGESSVAFIPVVHWSELQYSASWDEEWGEAFETVSYGDAEYTLVRPEQLVAEIVGLGCGLGEGCNGSGVRDYVSTGCPFNPPIPSDWRIVERCGICEQFDDDLEAANAVSQEARWAVCTNGDHHVVAAGLTAFGQQDHYPTPLISELLDLAEKNILIALSG